MNTSMKQGTLLAVLLLFLSVPTTGHATRVQRLTLSEIRDASEAIYVGTVVEVSTRLGATGRMVWTDYQVQVDEWLKGADQQRSIRLSLAGGVVGDFSIGISGVPTLAIGERYVFFIEKGSNLPMPTVGWGQGLFRVARAEEDGHPTEALVSIDGEPLQLDDAGRIGRGSSFPSLDSENQFKEAAPASERGSRVADPLWMAPNGDLVLQVAPAARAPQPDFAFATIRDLRNFVNGSVESVSAESPLH